MSRFLRAFATSALLGAAITAASAQSAPSPAYKDRGAYEVFSFGSSHDSSLGWTSEMNSGLGFDFTRALSIQAGVPIYLVSATTTTTTTTTGGTSTTTTTNHYNSLGDAYVALNLHPKFDSFGFSTGVVATAPTGNRSNGISTGRPTASWNSRVEKDIDRLTPFVEATLGNSLSNTKRFRRPFTTLGAVSTFTGGVSIDLFKGLSLEGSAYDVLPFGDQKIYSHNSKQVSPSKKRAFEQAAVTSGSSSLVKDHGFSGDLSISPTKRVGIDFAYTRSVGYALDTFSGTVSFRLGHLAAAPTQKD